MYGNLSDFKARLSVTTTGSDAQLTVILTNASSMVSTIIGKVLPSGAEERSYGLGVLLGQANRLLFLDGFLDPAIPPTVTNGDGTVLLAADYSFFPLNSPSPDALKLLNATEYVWTFGDDWDGLILVDGTWLVPDVVVEATYQLGTALYRSGEKDAITLTQAQSEAEQMLGAQPIVIGL